jgi:hypothetical protein
VRLSGLLGELFFKKRGKKVSHIIKRVEVQTFCGYVDKPVQAFTK